MYIYKYIYIYIYWGFHKWWYAQTIYFNGIFPHKNPPVGGSPTTLWNLRMVLLDPMRPIWKHPDPWRQGV